MTLLIEQNQEAIFDLCRKYGVARLEVSGSAAGDTFDPERSDVDFLVDFTPGQDLGPWLKHYFEFIVRTACRKHKMMQTPGKRRCQAFCVASQPSVQRQYKLKN